MECPVDEDDDGVGVNEVGGNNIWVRYRVGSSTRAPDALDRVAVVHLSEWEEDG